MPLCVLGKPLFYQVEVVDFVSECTYSTGTEEAIIIQVHTRLSTALSAALLPL
jgi:hypothetical protein